MSRDEEEALELTQSLIGSCPPGVAEEFCDAVVCHLAPGFAGAENEEEAVVLKKLQGVYWLVGKHMGKPLLKQEDTPGAVDPVVLWWFGSKGRCWYFSSSIWNTLGQSKAMLKKGELSIYAWATASGTHFLPDVVHIPWRASTPRCVHDKSAWAQPRAAVRSQKKIGNAGKGSDGKGGNAGGHASGHAGDHAGGDSTDGAGQQQQKGHGGWIKSVHN